MEKTEIKEEQILIRITGNDRPGLTASIMEILASKDAKILDIAQADIHSTLSLGILIRINEDDSGQVMKELLFKTTELGVQIGFEPVTDDQYEMWVFSRSSDVAFRQSRLRLPQRLSQSRDSTSTPSSDSPDV